MSLLITILVLATLAQTAPDTLTVVATNPPVWGPNPALVEEVRVGVIDGEPEYTFGKVNGIALGADGVLWVADGLAGTIRRFTADGSHLDDVGRMGEGPGEFSGNMGIWLARVSGGRVAAFDPPVRRVSVFDAAGVYLDGWPAPIACVTTRGGQFVATVDDTLLLRSCATRTGSDLLVRVDLDGAVVDTMSVPPRDTPSGQTARAQPFGSMPFYIPRNVSAPSPLGYLVSGRTSEYALFRPLIDGRVVRIERPWDPLPVTREEHAQIRLYRETSQERFRGAGVRTVSLADIPDTKPPFWAIQVDGLGRIWVARHAPGFHRPESAAERASRLARLQVPNSAMEWREPLVVDVLEPTGRFLGTLSFPDERTTLGVVTEEVVWAVVSGDYDEQYLVRYRITPG